MAESQKPAPASTNTNATQGSGTTNPDALAGTPDSLGAESVRDRRPATDDDTVEAMDEAGPGVTAPLASNKPTH